MVEDVVHSWNSFVKSALSTAAFVALIGSIGTGIFVFASDWKNLPTRVTTLNESIARLQASVDAIEGEIDLHIIDVLGDNIYVLSPEVKAGDPIFISFQARANISCDRNIQVRFYHVEGRQFYYETREDSATKSAVSDDYQQLPPIPVRTFKGMEPGTYYYVPTVVPVGCAGYQRQPLSWSVNTFRIVE